jgi:RNA polymerase sigma factor (sigma-70 family)
VDQQRPDDTELSDLPLGADFAGADEERAGVALETFLDRHENALRQLALRAAAGNTTYADDAFGQTMLEVWVQRRTFRPGCSWLAWVSIRLRSRVRDQFRRGLRHPGLGLPESAEGSQTALPDPKVRPPDQVAADRDEIQYALGRLAAANSEARDALVLRTTGYKVVEIADKLDVSVHRVYALLRTAHEFLGASLARNGGVPS